MLTTPNTPDQTSLPYRFGAGIMLINRDGLVWVGRRLPKWEADRSAYVWQMPQGGITPGEEPRDAAIRELYEETGVRSVEVIGETQDWLTYDLPEALVGVALKGRYRGQKQKWFAMRFLGDDSEIDISARDGQKAEFDAWRWAEPAELPDLIVSFKRDVYLALIAEFEPYTRRAAA